MPESAEQNADMTRFHWYALAGVLALSHSPLALSDEPIDPRSDHVGERLLDDVIKDFWGQITLGWGVRRRHRERDDRGLLLVCLPEARERHVGRSGGAAVWRRSAEPRRERRVHGLLDRRD